jgi:hypothetical protein
MSFRSVRAGAIITRVYYSVPDHYTTGDTFEDRDAAVTHAQAKHAALVESLTESLGEFSDPEQILANADTQIRVDLRWVIRLPDGGGLDITVESYRPVWQLRTSKSVAA